MWSVDGELCCIARDVLDHALLETLNYFYPGRTVGFFLAASHQIERLLDFVRKERAIESLYSGDSARHLREMAEEAPIIELVNNLLSQAVDLGASDIHVEPAEEHFAVRMRVDGVLHTRLTQPVERFSRGRIPDQARLRRRTSPSAGCLRTDESRPGSRAGRWTSGSPRCPAHSANPSCCACWAKERDELALEKRRHGGGPSRHVPELDPCKQRNRARHRTHRIGQVHDALRSAARGRRRDQEDHHGRGPRRVPDAQHHPDPDARRYRLYLRAGAAGDPPAGPRRHHDRRDARPGDGGDRDPLRPDRPHRAVHRAHQRRDIELHAADRHGGRAVPRRVARARRAGSATRAQGMRALRDNRSSRRPRSSGSSRTCLLRWSEAGGSRPTAASPAGTPDTAGAPGSSSSCRCPTSFRAESWRGPVRPT